MRQIDPKEFFASLSPKEQVEAKQDIQELRQRIWERVATTPVPDSSKRKPLRNLEGE